MKRAFAMTALGMLMVVPGCFVACPQTPAQSPAQTPPPSPDPSQPQSPAQTSPAPQQPAARPAQKKPADPGPQPTTRIDVAPLGYAPPSAFYLTYRLTSASLSFIDDDHLLFSFRVGGLLKRLPSDRDGDDDQQIRVMVLDAHTGDVLRQTEWRMHDRSQYLWPFPDGKFLVRVRDSLFLMDDSLVLKPYLSFDSALREIRVSPDRRMLVVERDDPPKLALPSADPQEPETRNPVKVEVLTSGSTSATVLKETQSPVNVPLVADGILDTVEGNQLAAYAVREVPFAGTPKILAQVRSTCQPTLDPVSAHVALVVGCYQAADDHPVVAINTDGKELWREQWDNKYVWEWFTSAQNGSRFAYESIQVARPISVFDELDESDISAQLVGVYDTESGKLVMVRNTSPVLTAGQNVSLSPDGQRFAVLRNGAIEIYDLPPVSARPPEAHADGAAKGPVTKGK
jgi:hypothetical protein